MHDFEGFGYVARGEEGGEELGGEDEVWRVAFGGEVGQEVEGFIELFGFVGPLQKF